MAPRKSGSKARGERPTMDPKIKKANHSTSENNRLKRIADGMIKLLALLPAEVQQIPGIEKKHATILEACTAEIAKELRREKDLEDEEKILEFHSQTGTIPTTSGHPNCRYPSPPDSLEQPAYDPTSNNISYFSSHDTNNNLGVQPNNLNAPDFNAYHMDDNFGDVLDNWNVYDHGTEQFDNNPQ